MHDWSASGPLSATTNRRIYYYISSIRIVIPNTWHSGLLSAVLLRIPRMTVQRHWYRNFRYTTSALQCNVSYRSCQHVPSVFRSIYEMGFINFTHNVYTKKNIYIFLVAYDFETVKRFSLSAKNFNRFAFPSQLNETKENFQNIESCFTFKMYLCISVCFSYVSDTCVSLKYLFRNQMRSLDSISGSSC